MNIIIKNNETPKVKLEKIKLKVRAIGSRVCSSFRNAPKYTRLAK